MAFYAGLDLAARVVAPHRVTAPHGRIHAHDLARDEHLRDARQAAPC
jgi:hypothetical protein